MIIIPIREETLDILEVLNGGVRPGIEDEPTFYIYRGENEHAEIIKHDELSDDPNQVWTVIKLMHRND